MSSDNPFSHMTKYYEGSPTKQTSLANNKLYKEPERGLYN